MGKVLMCINYFKVYWLLLQMVAHNTGKPPNEYVENVS